MRSPRFLALMALLLGTPPALATSPGYVPPWPDYADFEHDGKCVPLVQAATDVDALAGWDQEKLDELYACSKAGPVPDGAADGTIVFAKGGNFQNVLTYAGKIGIELSADKVRNLAQALWRGKIFYRADRALLNQIGPDVGPLLSVDIKLQRRFPAKVYCGHSLADARRESIVIDYAFTDRVKINGQSPYSDAIDWIAGTKTLTGKRGLNIRDEIRMVRPGLYLGRAYLERIFLLNFILVPRNQASGQDECFPGYTSVN